MIISHNCFLSIREKHRKQVIVYCSGFFDLTHARHILFLSRCKAQGDILVVGVGPDYDIRKNKGDGRPIYNEQVRIYIVDNLKPVDYCCLNRHMKKTNRLSSELETLQLLRPDIYAINDDAYDIPYRQRITNKLGIRLTIGEREGNIPPFLRNISTTETIKLIKKGG